MQACCDQWCCSLERAGKLKQSWHRAGAEQSCPGQAPKASQAPSYSHRVGLLAPSSLFPPTKASCGSSKAVGQGRPAGGPTSEQHGCAPVQLSAGWGTANPARFAKEQTWRVLPVEEYPYTVTLQSPILGRPKAHMPKFESLFQVFPDCTLEGRGKTEKQQRSPEATAALQLDRSLQYSSKIRFKLKKKNRKVKWRGGAWGLGSTEQGRQAGKRPHLYCSGKDTHRIFIS